MRLMTPEYASPEQVQGQAVTPATDVYSLGVLLYELLTGHRPYRFLSRAPHEIARVICEEKPVHPSVVITRAHDLLPTPLDNKEADTLEYLYESRGATVENLRRELSGDLDNIVMKALRKEPERRYQSADQLREDITRHLDGLPISAPSYSSTSIHTTTPGADASTAENSIAVLPLKSLESRRSGGEEANDEYLGVGLADALITRLSQLRRFSVRPTSSVMRYQALDSDPLIAGRELDVGFVLDGRIQHAGERIRVTVQLLDVWSGSAVWAGQFDEEFNDVLSLEDAITTQVAEAIVPHLSGDERRRLAKRSTDNPEAHEAYMRGRYYWSTFTEEGLAKALICYNQAVAHAPDYALAYTGIADYYNWLGIYAVLPFADTSAAALEAAHKAIALDDTLAEGYAALGFATIMHDFDWEAAERHLRRSVELNPNYVTGRLWLSYFLGMSGRFDEALTQVRRALEVAPLTPIAHQALSWAYYHARRYEESVAISRNLVANEPEYGIGFVFYSLSLASIRKYDEAIAAGLRSVELLGRGPYTLSWLATSYAAAGEREQAQALLDEIQEMSAKRYVSPYLQAMIYCTLGDEERALSELERALSIRDARLVWLGVDPLFDRLRDQERFEALLRQTNNPLIASRLAPTLEPQTGQKSVAVLPLQVLSQGSTGETGNEYLSVGLADALITRLSNVHRFIVRPTSSVLRYQGGQTDPLLAGRELGVDFVVVSTLRLAAGRIRVTAQLLSVDEGTTRWAGRFDENYTDVLSLEDSISEQVAVALVPHLSGDERRQLLKRGTDNSEAFEAFLRGRHYWYTMTEDGFSKAIACYERAASLDPSYAAAYAGISEYHCWLAVYGLRPPAEQLAEARRAAEQAIALDDTLAEAHTAHGLALLTHEAQWELAEVRFRRAIELNPNSTMAHAHYACQLGMESRFEESIREAKRAVEIDPINPFNSYILAWCLYQARRYDEGIAQSRRLLQSEPNYGSARFHLTLAFRRVGRYEEAVAEALKAVELLGEIPMCIAALGSAYAEAGRTEEARRVLDKLREMEATRYVSPYHRAFVHIYLGERDEALRLLEQSVAVSDPWIVWLGVEPQLDPLRSVPRFNDLLRRTNNPTTVRQVAMNIAKAQTPAAPSQIVSSDAAPATPVPASRPTEDEEANKLYVAGRYFATRRTAEGLRQGIERFERAVERDPQFALAYAEMADCYALLNWYVEPPPEGAWEKARKAARRAVEADDQLAEAHASLGFVKLHYERDFKGAENEFRRAIELKPDNPVAHRWRAFNLSAMGKHDEAISEIRRAQEISPRSAVMATAFANVLFFAQRFTEASEQCHRSLELDPGSIPTHIVLRWTYEMRGMCKEALAVYEQERAFAGDMPNTRAKYAHVLASCGRTEEAREVLAKLVAEREEQWVTAFEIAVIYALLQERDEAFKWLEQAEKENAVGLTYIRVDPRLNNLRADPRFDELLRRRSKPVDPLTR
jgi:tetratricopeptide (TPR) repeat protein